MFKNLFKISFSIILLFSPTIYACEEGYFILNNIGNGHFIQLSDESLWHVSEIDVINSMMWMPSDNIVICDNQLINTDDNEEVEAVRVQ